MSNNYRVHYKKGDTEIEVESTDKNYIDAMLAKLIELQPKVHVPGPGKKKKQQRGAPVRATADAAEGEELMIDVPTIVKNIHESDSFEQIEQNILNKKSQLGRVLLASYFAHQVGQEHLTTGDIEDITDELGVKIAQSNVSHCIADNRKYFTAGTTRKKGAKVPYKLNRQGANTFEKLLKQQKV
jgi:hypothetical protein